MVFSTSPDASSASKLQLWGYLETPGTHRQKERWCSQASGFDAPETPSQFSLNFPKAFMALSEAVARLSTADGHLHFSLSLQQQAHVFDGSNGVYKSDQLFLTQLHCFFSLCLLMEPESKKDTSSSSLKSSALSACLFPFWKGHLHNSEQPALLAVTKENFKQA